MNRRDFLRTLALSAAGLYVGRHLVETIGIDLASGPDRGAVACMAPGKTWMAYDGCEAYVVDYIQYFSPRRMSRFQLQAIIDREAEFAQTRANWRRSLRAIRRYDETPLRVVRVRP